MITREEAKQMIIPIYGDGWTMKSYHLEQQIDDIYDSFKAENEALRKELSKYVEAFKPLNTTAVSELIDSSLGKDGVIKELRKELSELKDNVVDTYEFQEFSMQGVTLSKPKRVKTFSNAKNSPPIRVTISEVKE